ncbi:MAG: 50S ribosomal protein L18e [Candidatus Micrarchaeota archaeon]|nr:50S ribosomal protein L18e [Candidatus Micrarchaeota archaeon]
MVQQGSTNKNLVELIALLEKSGRKNKAPIWQAAAHLLSRPTRKRVEVNLHKLVKYTGTVLVPGKVLSNGNGAKVTVAALAFSAAASQKISKAGGKTMSIRQLVELNPTGKNVTLII